MASRPAVGNKPAYSSQTEGSILISWFSEGHECSTLAELVRAKNIIEGKENWQTFSLTGFRKKRKGTTKVGGLHPGY